MSSRKDSTETLALVQEVNRRRAELHHSDLQIRHSASIALATLEGGAGLLQLNAALRDASVLVRLAAIEGLVDLRKPRLLRALIAMSADPEPSIRRAASAAIDGLTDDERRQLYLDALTDPEAVLRESACKALTAAEGPDVDKALIEALADTEGEVVAAAARALAARGAEGAASKLARAASHEAASARLAVCEALGVVGGRRQLDVVVDRLYDMDAAVRVAACHALGRLGRAESAKFLRRLTRHQPVVVRVAALESLARLGDSASIDTLVESLVIADPETRSLVGRALQSLGSPLVRERLASTLESRAAVRRAAACEFLAIVGDREDAPAIEALLEDDDWKVRRAAALAVGELGAPRSIGPLLPMLYDSEATVRGAASDALAALGEARLAFTITSALSGRPRVLVTSGDPRALATVVGAIHAPDPAIRAASVVALEATGDAVHIDRLAGAARDTNAAVRTRACAALGELGDTQAAGTLVGSLTDAVMQVREAAWRALIDLGFEAALEPLGNLLLHGPDTEARIVAADGLARTGEKGAVFPLAKALADPEPTVRKAVCASLGALGGSRAAKALVGALADPAPGVRLHAIETLVKLRDTRCYPLLLRGLGAPSPAMRAGAAHVLGGMGATRATEPLLRLLLDPVPAVTAAAKDALRRLDEAAIVEAIDGLQTGDATGLIALGDRRALPVILECYTAAGDAAVQRAATNVLAVIGDSHAVSPLVTSLRGASEPSSDATAALQAIGQRQLHVVQAWTRTLAVPSTASAAPPEVPREQLAVLETLVSAIAEPWFPTPLAGAVRDTMQAIGAVADRLRCGKTGAALETRTVKMGLLKRFKAYRAPEGSLAAIQVVGREVPVPRRPPPGRKR